MTAESVQISRGKGVTHYLKPVAPFAWRGAGRSSVSYLSLLPTEFSVARHFAFVSENTFK